MNNEATEILIDLIGCCAMLGLKNDVPTRDTIVEHCDELKKCVDKGGDPPDVARVLSVAYLGVEK